MGNISVKNCSSGMFHETGPDHQVYIVLAMICKIGILCFIKYLSVIGSLTFYLYIYTLLSYHGVVRLHRSICIMYTETFSSFTGLLPC